MQDLNIINSKIGEYNLKNEKLEIYFDMDGVIYCLDKIVIDHFNKDHNQNFNYKDNKCYWWLSTGETKEYFQEVLYRKGLFEDGEPIEGMVEVVNQLKSEGFDIYFLTMPQYKGSCYIEKCKFLKKHFPWINLDEHLIATGNKKLLAKENRVLVDDNSKFLIPWAKNKGISIGFSGQPWTLKYKGFQVNKSCDLYNLIKIIDKGSC